MQTAQGMKLGQLLLMDQEELAILPMRGQMEMMKQQQQHSAREDIR